MVAASLRPTAADDPALDGLVKAMRLQPIGDRTPTSRRHHLAAPLAGSGAPQVRDECVNINIFWSLAQARIVISD